MEGLKGILSRMRSYYDKLMALLVLVGLLASLSYLGILVGMIPDKQQEFVDGIDNIEPDHPHAVPVDTTVYEQAKLRIMEPPRLGTNSISVPERRVWCVKCVRPIPFLAMICPFCDKPQPPLPPDDWLRDTDNDGIPDLWEGKYGLDPLDPSDVHKDNDNDGFSNIEEFTAEPKTDLSDPNVEPGTNMNDPEDHPPLDRKLRVVKIIARAFKFRFMSVIILPDGTSQFGLNVKIRGKTRTYFKKLGEEVDGFTLERHEVKKVMKIRPGWKKPRLIDVPELTLKRGKKMITLEKGKDVPYTEYSAALFFEIGKKEFSVSIGDTFNLKEKKYLLKKVDPEKESVIIQRMQDGKSLEIRKFPERESSEAARGGSPVERK